MGVLLIVWLIKEEKAESIVKKQQAKDLDSKWRKHKQNANK